MTKNYIIDQGLNFYEELYKSLDESSSEVEGELCLITNVPLMKSCITLDCNHKFNYLPLYNDILNHKKNFNKLERRILKSSEIRCPYCRNIQNKLLPYHEMSGVKLVHGVNYFDETVDKISKVTAPTNDSYFHGACAYSMKYCNILEDGTKSEKTISCTDTYVKTLDLDGKAYCSIHKYFAMKNYQKEQKLKAVQQAKEAKIQAKIQEKEAKAQAKAEEKAAKEKVKAEAKMKAKLDKAQSKKKQQPVESEGENVIIGNSGYCVEIIKSGPKKGTQCGCKIKQDNFCGRHFKQLL